MTQTLRNAFTVAPAGSRVLTTPPGVWPRETNTRSTRLARYVAAAATKNLAIITIASQSVTRPLYCSSTHAPGCTHHTRDCSHHC